MPIDICYNHSCYADDPTGRFPSASYQRSPRLTPGIGRPTGATRSVVIRPATRGHAKAVSPGSGDLDVVGALCIADPSGKGRRIALAIPNAPPTDRDKSKCNNVPRLSGNRLARPRMPTLIRVPYLPQLYCGDRDSSGTRCTPIQGCASPGETG